METRAYYEPIIIEKINAIPDKYLPEIAEMLDVFKRVSADDKEISQSRKDELLSLIGSWQGFEKCEEMIEEIYENRKDFFAGRERL